MVFGYQTIVVGRIELSVSVNNRKETGRRRKDNPMSEINKKTIISNQICCPSSTRMWSVQVNAKKLKDIGLSIPDVRCRPTPSS